VALEGAAAALEERRRWTGTARWSFRTGDHHHEDGGTQIVCYQTTCAGHLLQCGTVRTTTMMGFTDWRDPSVWAVRQYGGTALTPTSGGHGQQLRRRLLLRLRQWPRQRQLLLDHRCDTLEARGALCPTRRRASAHAIAPPRSPPPVPISANRTRPTAATASAAARFRNSAVATGRRSGYV